MSARRVRVGKTVTMPALMRLFALLKDDPSLKVVLKEFPILGPGSVEAARVAVAVRMQDGSGEKYLASHKELLGNPGPASKVKALAAAKTKGSMSRSSKRTWQAARSSKH